MRTPLVDQQFGYVHFSVPLLDIAGISTEFSEAITAQFFVSPIRWRASLLCRAGYMLGYATHF